MMLQDFQTYHTFLFCEEFSDISDIYIRRTMPYLFYVNINCF